MPNQTDWMLLKKNINEYGTWVSDTWGGITEENSETVYLRKFGEQNLFEFLLSKGNFFDANTLTSCISLNEKILETVYKSHHEKYCNLLKILCTNNMLLFVERYFENTNNDGNPQKINFETYKFIISQHHDKIINNEPSENMITDLINEFRLLTHPCIDDFYNFSLEIEDIDNINDFKSIYKKYTELIPLIYRLINEYYLEYIKYQIGMINDMMDNSYIVVSEYYYNIKKCIYSLPSSYVDFRYQDKRGNNILFYLTSINLPSEQINEQVYQSLLHFKNLPLKIQNFQGDTLFHYAAHYKNEKFLDFLLNWIQENSKNKSKIIKILESKNIQGQNVYDILLDNKYYSLILKLKDYTTQEYYLKMIEAVANNSETLDLIKDNELYINCIDYYISEMIKMKTVMLYDITKYNYYKKNIEKILSSTNVSNHEDFFLKTLFKCVQINELKIFDLILTKGGIDLNKKTKHHEYLIITCIKEEKIQFVKCLLKYDIDLFVCDELNRSAMIITLETKNLRLVNLIKNHICDNPKYSGMCPIMNIFIDLMEGNDKPSSFSNVFAKMKMYIENVFD